MSAISQRSVSIGFSQRKEVRSLRSILDHSSQIVGHMVPCVIQFHIEYTLFVNICARSGSPPPLLQLLYPVIPRLAISERSDSCRLEEMNIILERDLRLRDKSTRKNASVTDQRIRHLLLLALDGEGVVGTVSSAQSQRMALHSGHSL